MTSINYKIVAVILVIFQSNLPGQFSISPLIVNNHSFGSRVTCMCSVSSSFTVVTSYKARTTDLDLGMSKLIDGKRALLKQLIVIIS